MGRKWAWLGVALFVALDAVLVVWAVNHTRDGAPTSASAPLTQIVSPATTPPTATPLTATPPIATPPETSTAPPSSTETAEPSATTDPAGTSEGTAATGSSILGASGTSASPTGPDALAAKLGGTVLMDMANDGTVIRATRGGCVPPGDSQSAADQSPDPPAVEVSDDFGETWEPVPAAVTSAAHAVVRVAARGGGRSWFVTADADCEVTEHDASAGAEDWSTSSPEGAWALPTDALQQELLAPGGRIDIDCTPAYLAAIDAKHAVLACTDGSLLTTANSGNAWAEAAQVPGVVSISFVGTNMGYALAVTDECAAQVLTTADGGATWASAACLDGETAQSITAAGTTVLAMVDGAVQRSDDKGVTW